MVCSGVLDGDRPHGLQAILCLSCESSSYGDHPCLSSGGGRPSGLWRASWGGSGQDGRRHGGCPLSLPGTPGAGVEVSPVSSLGG